MVYLIEFMDGLGVLLLRLFVYLDFLIHGSSLRQCEYDKAYQDSNPANHEYLLHVEMV